VKDLRRAWLITLKDLRLEFRTGGRLLSMIAFVILAGFLFAFALDSSLVAGRDVAAALLWLIILFASTAGAGRIRRWSTWPNAASPKPSMRWRATIMAARAA